MSRCSYGPCEHKEVACHREPTAWHYQADSWARLIGAPKPPQNGRISPIKPGVVDKIIPSRRSRQKEKAQIAVDAADHRHQDLRIENALTDENGAEVKLKKDDQVEVMITTEPKTAKRHN